jgi:2-oxo-4-hydroxy-4-carboxy-5-ureidoimidazoline decarboxylase
VSDLLVWWNQLPAEHAAQEILPCCGSQAWAAGMAGRQPLLDEDSLLKASDEVWRSLSLSDWSEAFSSHPRIGESGSSQATTEKSVAWSVQEQQEAVDAVDDVKVALAAGNQRYEERFGRTFIVCATGKSAGEILEILDRRLQNDEAIELAESAEQQRQITQLRLKKWLGRR